MIFNSLTKQEDNAMPIQTRTCLLMLALAVAGCGAGSGHDSVLSYISVVDDQHIAVHASKVPDAVISAAGDLAIEGRNVTLDASQKSLLARYFASAMAIRKDGVAVGVAGAETGGNALRSVAAGLTGGDPDKIGAEVEASAAKIDIEVGKLCSDLAQLQSTQASIATTLAAFKPYAALDSRKTSDCRSK